MKQWKIFAALCAVFVGAYSLPLSDEKVTGAIIEAFKMLQWYAREHTLACVVPALFIAGAITTFLSKATVLRYLGPRSNKAGAYAVASVSGTVLAVCSCSVLPMFAGIYRLGAGLGPAAAFLYAGPAINVLALFLTARVLGFEMGAARAVGAVVFGLVIGLLMALIFRRSEQVRAAAAMHLPEPEKPRRAMWQTGLYFFCMIAFLVFSDWYNPNNVVVHTRDGRAIKAVLMQATLDEYQFQVEEAVGELAVGDEVTFAKADIVSMEEEDTWVIRLHHIRWYLAGAMGLAVLAMALRWFDRRELTEWMHNTWDFAKMIVPLLFGGVFAVGFLGALMPSELVASWVGDNSAASVRRQT